MLGRSEKVGRPGTIPTPTPTPAAPGPGPPANTEIEQAQSEEPSLGRSIGGRGHSLRCGHSMGASVPPPARPSGPAGAATMGRPPLLRPAPKRRAAPSPALRPARSLARRAAADSIASFMSFSLSSRHSPPPPLLLLFFSLLPEAHISEISATSPHFFFLILKKALNTKAVTNQ